jgi:hypothetical protein
MPGRGGKLTAGRVSVVNTFGVFLLESCCRGGMVGLVDLPLLGMVAAGAKAQTMQRGLLGCCCVCANWIDG